jgi:hypothetical protein
LQLDTLALGHGINSMIQSFPTDNIDYRFLLDHHLAASTFHLNLHTTNLNAFIMRLESLKTIRSPSSLKQPFLSIFLINFIPFHP